MAILEPALCINPSMMIFTSDADITLKMSIKVSSIVNDKHTTNQSISFL